MERRIKEINRFTVGWTGLLRVCRHHPAVRAARQMAAPQAQTGALERVEAPTNALPEPPHTRCHPRPRRPLMGGITDGLLARRRILATPTRAAQHLLAQDHRPERVHRPLPPLPGMLSEPPGADPHAGWCGRGQGEPGLYPILRAPGGENCPRRLTSCWGLPDRRPKPRRSNVASLSSCKRTSGWSCPRPRR